MPKSKPPAVLICLDCGAAVLPGNSCSRHPKEPLFDPNSPLVQKEMRLLDERRLRKHEEGWMTSAVAVVSIVAFPLSFGVGLETGSGILIGLTFMAIATPIILFFRFIAQKRAPKKYSKYIKASAMDSYSFGQSEIDAIKRPPSLDEVAEVFFDMD